MESAGSGKLAPDVQRWRQLEAAYGDSPIHRTFGLTLTVVGDGEVVVHATVTEAAANRQGIVAGGVLAQLLDSAAVQAARTRLGSQDRAVTAGLNVNFLRPARPGGTLIARGSLVDMSHTLAVGHADVRDGQDTLLAVGLVTIRLLRAPG